MSPFTVEQEPPRWSQLKSRHDWITLDWNGVSARQQSRSRKANAQDVEQQNHYQLLNVAFTASAAEITRAYRDAMKSVHPDRVRADQRVEAEERAKALNLAYAVLSKPEARRTYDASLKAEAVQEQIMSRYFGGVGGPGSADDTYERIRRQAAADRRRQAENERGATLSLLVVFGALFLLVVSAIFLWAVVSSIVNRAFS